MTDLETGHTKHFMLHRSMWAKFHEWIETMFKQDYGYSYAELCEQEQLIARLYVVSTGPSPSPEALQEFERVVEQYKKVWLPRRQALEK